MSLGQYKWITGEKFSHQALMAAPAAADEPDTEGGEYLLVKGNVKFDPALFFDTEETRLQLVGPKIHTCIFS